MHHLNLTFPCKVVDCRNAMRKHKSRLSRACAICGRTNLVDLSSHLRQKHNLNAEQRKPYLRGGTRQDAARRAAVHVSEAKAFFEMSRARKRRHLLRNASDAFITFLRQILINVQRGNVYTDLECRQKLFDIDCDWYCYKLAEPTIPMEKARRFLSRSRVLDVLECLIPKAIVHLSGINTV